VALVFEEDRQRPTAIAPCCCEGGRVCRSAASGRHTAIAVAGDHQ
jgi:hypothetical protein